MKNFSIHKNSSSFILTYYWCDKIALVLNIIK